MLIDETKKNSRFWNSFLRLSYVLLNLCYQGLGQEDRHVTAAGVGPHGDLDSAVNIQVDGLLDKVFRPVQAWVHIITVA